MISAMTLNRCKLCGFETKSRMVDGRCKSTVACLRRLRAGHFLKRAVRLKLESSLPWDEDTLAAAENVREAARVAREIRKSLYIYGLCIGCGIRPHSPGRPRCEQCHRNRA